MQNVLLLWKTHSQYVYHFVHALNKCGVKCFSNTAYVSVFSSNCRLFMYYLCTVNRGWFPFTEAATHDLTTWFATRRVVILSRVNGALAVIEIPFRIFPRQNRDSLFP